MDYEVIWTEPAVADLEAITAYIGRRSPAAAERVGAAILRHVEILSTFPYIGPVYPRNRSGAIREILCKKPRIFYRVSEQSKQVLILTVWHGSRDEPDGLPGF